MPQPKKTKSSALTKEFFEKTFDEKLKGVATKKDLAGLVTNETLDKKLTGLATKADLEKETNLIGVMIKNAFEDHQMNFLQEQFDRLVVTQSLASEIQS